MHRTCRWLPTCPGLAARPPAPPARRPPAAPRCRSVTPGSPPGPRGSPARRGWSPVRGTRWTRASGLGVQGEEGQSRGAPCPGPGRTPTAPHALSKFTRLLLPALGGPATTTCAPERSRWPRRASWRWALKAACRRCTWLSAVDAMGGGGALLGGLRCQGPPTFPPGGPTSLQDALFQVVILAKVDIRLHVGQRLGVQG